MVKTSFASEPRLDCSLLTRISGPLGSNPAGVFADNSGQRYYIKTLESLAHLRNEYIAAQLYQLAGVPTLSYQLTSEPDQLATLWIDLDKKAIHHFTEQERKQAQQWFAVHAWTANWDVAGFNGDNQGTHSGKVYSLDLGGALNFRAMGDPKGKAFAFDVPELISLRQDSDNPYAIKLFADMSDAQISSAIKRVTQLCDDKIEQTILANLGSAKLVDKMLKRKAYMAALL